MTRQTGRLTLNHESQLGGELPTDIRSMAKMFWGLAIGDVMPPTLAARAIPMTRAVLKGSSAERVRRMGWTML